MGGRNPSKSSGNTNLSGNLGPFGWECIVVARKPRLAKDASRRPEPTGPYRAWSRPTIHENPVLPGKEPRNAQLQISKTGRRRSQNSPLWRSIYPLAVLRFRAVGTPTNFELPLGCRRPAPVGSSGRLPVNKFVSQGDRIARGIGMLRKLTRRTFMKRTATGLGAGLIASSTSLCRGVVGGEAKDQPRLAICNETFKDWPLEKAFHLAAECGYQGIEIAPFTISDYVTDVAAPRRAEIRRQAESEGLEIAGLHWLLSRTKGFHLTSPDPGIRRETARYLGSLAQFCADLGGKLMVFGSPPQRNLAAGVSRAKGMQYAAEVLRETLPILEKTNVRIAMEPLSPRTTNFLRTAAEAAELVKLVDSPRCRLILDCLAMSNEPTAAPDLIRRYADLLIHFHANDPNSRGPGMGDLDFVPILRALREVDYRGWISVEVFDYSPGAEQTARESIQYLKKILSEMA